MRKKNWVVTLVALLGFQAGGAVVSAKDYVVDETDIKITYAVNTTDLIARVKKVETVYLSKRQSVEIPKILKYKSGSKTYNLTVTKIGDNAFEHIDYKTIKLPNTITHIGKRAFAYTSSTEINVPSQLQSIGEEAFAYSDIRSFNIPGTVTYIGPYAFWAAPISSVSFQESDAPLSIGAGAYCGAAVREVTLPARLASLGPRSFCMCASLESFTMSYCGITKIPEQCFHSSELLRNVNLPSNISEIGENAFWRCYSLSDIVWPTALKTIGDEAFSDCNFKGIYFPAGLESIGEYAFESNDDLTIISFPASLRSIGQYGFLRCDRLSSVSCDAIVPPATVSPVFSDVSHVPLAVPVQSVEAYRTAPDWRNFSYEDYPTGVEGMMSSLDDCTEWYDLNGRRLEERPTAGGIYIRKTPLSTEKHIIR